MCIEVQGIKPGSINRPLIQESCEFLAQACKRIYSGKKASEKDVMLKLGIDMLPAHRSLLTESFAYFEAMFQASPPYSRKGCWQNCVSLEKSC